MARQKQRKVIESEPTVIVDPLGNEHDGYLLTLACGHTYEAYVALKTTTCPQCDVAAEISSIENPHHGGDDVQEG